MGNVITVGMKDLDVMFYFNQIGMEATGIQTTFNSIGKLTLILEKDLYGNIVMPGCISKNIFK